jgi:hypothetical protein
MNSYNLLPSPLVHFLVYRSPEEGQVARAKVLTEDLLQVVRSEHAKMQTILHQQQMELHHAQAQYAAYSAMAVGTFHLWCWLTSYYGVRLDSNHGARLKCIILI